MTNATTEAPAETPTKPLNLKDISQLGYTQLTREVFKGVVVTMQTLSISRQQKILSTIPASTDDPVVKFTHLQVETLANSTLAVNDTKYTEADLDTLRSFYGSLQSRVLQSFYAVYEEMMATQEETLGSLKKT